MAHLDLQRGTWSAADTLLGTRSSRIIGHNTSLHRRGDDIAVRYHTTDIVTFGADRDSLTVDTHGWHTSTTWQRVNALLPGPYVIHSHRVRGASTPWLYAGGYPVTPFVDGLTLHPDAGTVTFGGQVILTADDIAAIRTAAEAAAVERGRKRAARLLREHPVPRTFGPDLPTMHSQYGGVPEWGGHGHRAAYDCASCIAERAAFAVQRADALRRSHGGLTLTSRNGSDTSDVVTTYPAHATLTRTGWGATSGCPWDCPLRETPSA